MANGPTYGQAFYINDSGVVTVNPDVVSIAVAKAQALTAALTTTSTIAATDTVATAALGTVRAIYGKILNSHAAVTSGNIVGVRGEVNCAASSTLTDAFLYGVQGKLITNSATLVGGSAHICGVYGQLDVSSGTLTSGHIAGVISNIYGFNSGSSSVLDLFYGEAAGGGVINSGLKLFGKCNYVFDIETNVHTQASGTGTVTTNAGYIKVLIDGAVRYIGLGSAVS